MNMGENSYDRINDYASVKISLARPHDIRSWSFGEVKKPERSTIVHTDLRRRVCFAKEFSGRKRIGNAPAVNTEA